MAVKAIMKREGDGEHPASHYLVVEDSSKSTTWHLRVRGTDGKPDHILMGAAWAALHGGYRGNKYQGPNKAEALRKLMSLYRSEGMPLPGGNKSMFFKDKSGQAWYIGIYSNNFEDRQGDILTEDSHIEFVNWMKETGVKPPIVMIHQPKFPDILHFTHYLALITKQITADEYNANLMELYKSTAIAQAETAFVLNGFVFVIGKILKNKEAMVEQLMTNKTNWGMSHGFIKLGPSDGIEDNVVTKYRSFEFSAVPSMFAANNLTSISAVKEELMDTQLKDLSEGDRRLLEQVMGDVSDDLEQATAKAKEILSGVLNSKADMPEVENVEETPAEETLTEETPEKQPVSYAEIRVKLMDDLKMEELTQVLKGIGETLDRQNALITDQANEIKMLQTKMSKLERSEDERLAEFITPDWSAAFKQTATTVEDAEKIGDLKKNIPERVVEKSAADAGKDNPLKFGFHDFVWKNESGS